MSEEEFLELAHEVKEQTEFDRSTANDNAEINPDVRKRARSSGHKRTIDELEATIREEINNKALSETLSNLFRTQTAARESQAKGGV